MNKYKSYKKGQDFKQEKNMKIDMLIKKRVLTIYFDGELDEYTADKIRRNIDFKIDEGGYDNAVFDFTNLKFMDSTGIGMLIGRYKKLKKRSVKAYIRNACVQVEKVLRMTGIYEIMPKLTNSEVV